MAKVVAVDVATLHGFNCTIPSIPVPKFCDVTVTTPVVAAVATLATYLLVAEADSQPQVFAVAGNTFAVWNTSEIVVRQAEAARITSEAFALTV